MAVSDFIKTSQSTPATTDVSPVRNLFKAGTSFAQATRRFFLPNRQEEFDRRQKEAQQSLLLTPELGRSIDQSIGGVGPGVKAGAPASEFFNAVVIDQALGFGAATAVTRKITKTLISKLTKISERTGVEEVLKKSGLELSEDVIKRFAPVISRTGDEQVVRRILSKAISESPVATKAASTAAGLTRERGFVTSARKVVPTAEKLGGQYVPRGTTNLAIKARNLVLSDAAEAERIVREFPLSDESVAIGSELLKKLADDIAKQTDAIQKTALEDKAAQIANELAAKLTEVGRTIQAASILGRLTPEGQVRFAAREIQKFNIQNPNRRIPELSGEQASYILKEAKEIQLMPSSREQAERYQRLQDYIGSLVPTPLYKKLVAIWKAGLLTGIKTSGLNLFSNITHSLSEVAKDVPAAIVDSAAALFTGERTKTLTLRTAFDGMKEGSIKGVRYFSTGFDERNVGAKIDYKRVNFGQGKVAKAFQVYTDTVFRALAVGDQPFYYAALSRSMMDQALAAGKTQGLRGKELVEYAYTIVESPTEQMLQTAVSDAATAVFINETLAGKAAAKIQSLPGGEFIIPFGRTPSAVGMQAIAYSPVGVAATLFRNIGKGRFNQRDFAQGMGRGLTGTAVLALGMELAKNKMVATPYPVGDEKEQKLQEAEGVKNGYILIGGKWRSPLVLGPAGVVLQAGAFFQLALDSEGSPTDAAVKGFAQAGNAFLELPFLTGLQDAINAVTNPERYAKGYLPGLIASFVPTLVADIARSTDPLERVPSARTLVESIGTRVKSRIPGLRETLEPRVNILGYPVERAGNTVEVMFDPTRPSKAMETPVTMEFRRLHNEGYRVSPTALGDKYGYKSLTPAQNTRLWQITGTLIDQKVTALIAHPAYANMSDEERAAKIEEFVKRSKEIARATMLIELTTDMEGDKLKSELSKQKEGGLMTRDIFNKYLELR